MSRNRLLVLAIILVDVIAEGIILRTWAQIIPSCGCQNADGQPYPWCPVNPCPSTEALNVESSKLNSPTNMTLSIRSTGSRPETLIAYYVKDPANNQYSSTNWAGPTIAPSTLTSINILIDGAAFTFQSRTTYTVEMATSRNSQFTFTITA